MTTNNDNGEKPAPAPPPPSDETVEQLLADIADSEDGERLDLDKELDERDDSGACSMRQRRTMTGPGAGRWIPPRLEPDPDPPDPVETASGLFMGSHGDDNSIAEEAADSVDVDNMAVEIAAADTVETNAT